nr:ATP synthase subunit I [Paenibacillus lemnae]
MLLLSLLFMGWAVYDDNRDIFAGLIMGVMGGLINVRFLSIKVRQLAELAVSQENKRFSFGFVTRLCIAFLIVMIAARFEQISLGATIAGLFIPQLLTIPVSIMVSLRKQ